MDERWVPGRRSDDDGDITRREGRWRARLDRLSLRRTRLGLIHAVVVIAGLAVLLSAPGLDMRVVAGAIVLAALHFAFRHARRRLGGGAERASAMLALLKDRRLRRARDWDAMAGTAATAADRAHPFAEDAGIVGRNSLLTLLDTTTTELAHNRLRSWLTMSKSDPAATAERQALVAELEPRTHFRTRLRMAARHAGGWRQIDDGLRRVDPPARPWWLVVFHLVCWGLVALAWAGSGSLWSFALLVPAGTANLAATRDRNTGQTAHELQTLLDDASRVFAVMERYRAGAGAPALAAVLAPLQDRREPPSVLARRARRVFGWATVELTPGSRLVANLLAPFSALLLIAMARVTDRMAESVPAAVDAWGQIDACSALATIVDLGRADEGFVFASFFEKGPVVDEAAPMLVAADVGHPFLAEKTVNPVVIPADGRPAFVTGSNMTGKSTYLRSIAINLALANAGARVQATQFSVRPFRLVTSIAPHDDLVSGVSRFYAEVERVAGIVDTMDRPGPGTLFLIDEIFSGTNGLERRAGIARVVHLLARPGNGGLITTHDVETVAEISALRDCSNRHFTSTVVADSDAGPDGKRLIFDYRIRDGISRDTNALFILDRHGITDPDASPHCAGTS
ncbi:hypothetical protein [Fodinicurvata sp. EGI_FJ10296]|uniref:MutS-related protein n=1 Tax=Fodinicurvata sp. EGI_FJ10296 TaxID=3231908 RepID=UPI003455AED0